MGKQLGIQMIEMYVGMIRDEFQPLMAELNVREMAIKEQIEARVKKDFGIYDMMMEREALKLQLAEIDNRLSSWEKRTYMYGKYTTKIDYAVEAEMEKLRNGLGKQIQEVKSEAIKSVRLIGTSDEVVNIFKDISKQVADMSGQLQALPAPETLVPAIKSRRKKKAN